MQHDRAIAIGDLCIHEAFERMAALHPRKTAVVCGDTRWSYQELNAHANRIAHALVAFGIGPDEPVAIALTRSCAHIAAMLGVLKSGGAYVPIVDNQPATRLRMMLNDCGARCMIGASGHLDALHNKVGRLITLESCRGQPESNVAIQRSPGDLAYIMYTSGSTGEPKGVMIEHNGVLRLVHDQWFMPTGPDVHYLCVSSFGFDASTIEVFAALLHGGTLAITTRRVPEPDEVRRLIREENVSAAWIAFGFFGALFEADPGMFESVEVLMTGGEPVTAELIRRAQRALPSTRFVNSYGPTECTSLSTAYEIPVLDDDASGMLPIGKALRGMRTRVVDQRGNEVGIGGTGELLISGVGIARGYLNAPELTMQRFHTDDRGQRAYNSGDLVRVLDDGNLMFLRRIDDQIKVRGQRIELGEIESAAAVMPGVRAAAACVIGEGPAQSIAMAVVTDQAEFDSESLIEKLRDRLPEYMIPASVRAVGVIPLNRNGKVDHEALAVVFADEETSAHADADSPLVSRTQRELAEIISGLLGTPVRSSEDDFLRLGGHSLRAVIFASRIRDRFGVRLPISRIYELRTVGRIAADIETQHTPGAVDIGIERVDQGDRSALSFNQQRLWMLAQLNPDDPSYTITIRLESDEPLNRECFERAWRYICRRHAVLRSRIVIDDGVPYQETSDEQAPGVQWVGADALVNDELERAIGEEPGRVFDLDGGALARCTVYAHRNGASVVIGMHHIISDAWSCEILQRELSVAYESLAAGEPPRLPELPIGYADFAHWEHTLVESDVCREDIEYWLRTLGGAESVELPADELRSPTPDSRGHSVSRRLDVDTAAQVRGAADELGVTPFSYMLGVFKVWIHRLTLQEDLVIGTPIANRERTETEGIIGFFMETVALRTRVACSDTLAGVIRRVSETSLEGFDHLAAPFQHIVHALDERMDQGRNPLFEIFFNHITTQMRSEDGAGGALRFSDRTPTAHTAKFDLTCYIYDQPAGPEIIFNYRTALFRQETIERYIGQYLRLLRASTTHLNEPISQLPVLDEAEPIPGDAAVPDQAMSGRLSQTGLIHDFVARRAEDTPDRLAVRSASGLLSYRELWNRSSAVAAGLEARGVAPGDRVMLCAADAMEYYPALLAVLRSGAVFVPTDPSWPDARLIRIAALSRPSVVLADTSQFERSAATGVPIQRIADLITSPPPPGTKTREDGRTGPSSPAYMLFTSGSTGEPKGVVQSHGAVVGHMHTFAHSVELTSDDRLMQLASPAFDAAIMDVFGCWFTGSCLCVFDLQRGGNEELTAYLDDCQITVWHSTPSVLRWFSGSKKPNAIFTSVRAVVLGGEQAVRDDLESVIRCFPACDRFINGLGPSESSLGLQLRIDPRKAVTYARHIPVGYAVEGVRARLLDRDGNPTTLSGEIEIETDRIALGYLDPETGQLRGIGVPVEEGRSRRFRTGDMGTMLADGTIVHLGRRDHQVQVRGCRVETEEVARAIRSIPQVRDAAVLAQKTPTGSHTLAAYLVCDDPSPSRDTLRGALARLLPMYMVPEQWSRVASIPRVGGGKLDRASLSHMPPLTFDEEAQEENEEIGLSERAVIDAFEEVLGTKPVAPGDSFFILGGNSLKAIRLFSILRKQLGTELPVSTIYRAYTPRLLAREIDDFEPSENGPITFITLRKSQEPASLYLLPGIGGHPLGFGPLIELLDSRFTCIGVQYPSEEQIREIGPGLPRFASWIIDRVPLATGRAPDMLGYSFGGSLAIEIAIQLQQRGYAPGRLIMLDAHLPRGLPRKSWPGNLRTHLSNFVSAERHTRVEYLRSRVWRERANRREAPEERHDLRDFRASARINREMLFAYEPHGQYSGEIKLVQAIQPDWLRFHRDDGCNGFTIAAPETRIEKHPLDARHLELFNPGPVSELARIINRWLREEPPSSPRVSSRLSQPGAPVANTD